MPSRVFHHHFFEPGCLCRHVYARIFRVGWLPLSKRERRTRIVGADHTHDAAGVYSDKAIDRPREIALEP